MGTIARPVMVGPHIRTFGFVALRKALRDCATAVWIVKAGRAMDAMDWNVARWTAVMAIRVGSEKLAASMGEGPLWYALYDS